MSKYLKTQFDLMHLPSISKDQIDYLVECCVFFETKGDNPQALNVPLLGVTPIYFTSTDIELFYTIFGIDENKVKKIIADFDLTEDTWHVVNDPYNHMVIYVAHLVLTSKNLNNDYKQLGLQTLFKLLHYKFFTSLVYNSYKRGANKATMEYVINNLSNKFDIIRYSTWKKVIEERSKDIYAPNSIHYKTLLNYDNDEDIIYVLSDIQSRIRQKIVLINRQYYDAKERNDAIKEYKVIDSIDGEKVIKAITGSYESMITNLQQQIQTPSRFLDGELINVICSRFKEVSNEMFRMHLNMFCELASIQAETKKYKEIIKVKNQKTGEDEEVYISCNILIRELIQKTYRYCQMSKVNMQSKGDILLKTINSYTSSRVVDPDIVKIKRSFIYFVMNGRKVSRPASIANIALGMIAYLMIKSFNFM